MQAKREDRRVSPKDLIVMLQTSSATVTNVIERLVTRGYVTREQHPTDRRAQYVRPTQEARDLVEQVYGIHHGAVVSVIDGLNEVDSRVAASIIRKIADALDELALRP